MRFDCIDCLEWTLSELLVHFLCGRRTALHWVASRAGHQALAARSGIQLRLVPSPRGVFVGVGVCGSMPVQQVSGVPWGWHLGAKMQFELEWVFHEHTSASYFILQENHYFFVGAELFTDMSKIWPVWGFWWVWWFRSKIMFLYDFKKKHFHIDLFWSKVK